MIMNILRKIYRRIRLARASMSERLSILRPLFYHLGNNVELYSTDLGTEPYLICIEDNVCVAEGVKFITHDVSCFRVAQYMGINKNNIDKVGSIVLKDNCFIGAYTILMPNTSVGRNSVIAAGSVVTKNIPDNEVWGGSPAKFIMTIDEYARKVLEKSALYPWLNLKNISHQEMVVMRQKYFFNNLKY